MSRSLALGILCCSLVGCYTQLQTTDQGADGRQVGQSAEVSDGIGGSSEAWNACYGASLARYYGSLCYTSLTGRHWSYWLWDVSYQNWTNRLWYRLDRDRLRWSYVSSGTDSIAYASDDRAASRPRGDAIGRGTTSDPRRNSGERDTSRRDRSGDAFSSERGRERKGRSRTGVASVPAPSADSQFVSRGTNRRDRIGASRNERMVRPSTSKPQVKIPDLSSRLKSKAASLQEKEIKARLQYHIEQEYGGRQNLTSRQRARLASELANTLQSSGQSDGDASRIRDRLREDVGDISDLNWSDLPNRAHSTPRSEFDRSQSRSSRDPVDRESLDVQTPDVETPEVERPDMSTSDRERSRTGSSEESGEN